MQHSDVIVIGGGPGGLSAALMLARQGVQVDLFEKRSWPVDKACGEGIMPTGLAVLRELGVDVPGQPFSGIRYSLAGSDLAASADFAEGPGRAVRRLELSIALLDVCRGQEGLRLHQDCAARIVDGGPDGMDVEAAGQRHRARLVVAADGLHSASRRWAGLQGESAHTRRWGMRQHFAIAPWSSRVEVIVAPNSEAYLAPVGPNELGVAVLGDAPKRSRTFLEMLQDFPDICERLQGVPPSSEVRSLGPLEQKTRQPATDGLVLLGDACGYVDACTGEGISLALAQSQILARLVPPLLRHGFGRVTLGSELATAYRRLLRPYKITTYGNLFINSRPWLRNRVLLALGRQPQVFQALLSLNMGTLSPATFVLRYGARLLRALL